MNHVLETASRPAFFSSLLKSNNCYGTATNDSALLGSNQLGRDPDSLPREAIARDGDQPRLRASMDSPPQTTTGDLEAMALYAGQDAGAIHDIPPAAARLADMDTQPRPIPEGMAGNDSRVIS